MWVDGLGRDGDPGVMPRYLFETPLLDDTARERAGRVAAERFPEMEIEHTYVTERDDVSREVWVCRAPSASHVERWAAATQLPLGVVRRVDADVAARLEGGSLRRSEPPSRVQNRTDDEESPRGERA